MAGNGRRVGIIGAGRLGSALAMGLAHAGFTIAAVASRTEASASRLAGLCGAACAGPAAVVAQSDIIFLTVPDRAIAPVAETLAAAFAGGEGLVGRCVYHTCGALDAAVLEPLKHWGAAVGSLHPLQSFVDRDSWRNLENCYVAVEGDEPAVKCGLEVAQAFGGRPFTVPSGKKMLYHAAAAIASNYLVAVETLARDVMMAAGVAPEQALEVLRPLVEGTLRNAFTVGVPRALTGPISRGDVAIVDAHRDELLRAMPQKLGVWGALGELTLECAQRNGTVADDVVAKMRAVFAGCRATPAAGRTPGKGGDAA